MSEPEINWSDPPRKRNGKEQFPWFWDALRERSGMWAEYPKVYPHGKNPLPLVKHRGPDFEATQRKFDDGIHMWVRFVGETE